MSQLSRFIKIWRRLLKKVVEEPEKVRADLSDAITIINTLEPYAPDVLKPDIERVRKTLRQCVEAIDTIDSLT